MSAVIEKFIACDGCGDNYGTDNRHYTIYEQRHCASLNGWVYRNGQDLCEECKMWQGKTNREESDNAKR